MPIDGLPAGAIAQTSASEMSGQTATALSLTASGQKVAVLGLTLEEGIYSLYASDAATANAGYTTATLQVDDTDTLTDVQNGSGSGLFQFMVEAGVLKVISYTATTRSITVKAYKMS